MDQWEVKHLFDRFERAVRYDRRVKGIEVRLYMLKELTREGVCTFQHMDTGHTLKFNALTYKLIIEPAAVKVG